VKFGADPTLTTTLLTALTEDPRLRRMQSIASAKLPAQALHTVEEQYEMLQTSIQALERLCNGSVFAGLSPAFQGAALREFAHLLEQCLALGTLLIQAWVHISRHDPELPWLYTQAPEVRRRGRRSHRVSTLFMVLMTDHLRERTGKPYCRYVGRVAEHLFPGCIAQSVLKTMTGWRAVRDRCKQLKRGHGVRLHAICHMLMAHLPQ
jgi:hypothetical protein